MGVSILALALAAGQTPVAADLHAHAMPAILPLERRAETEDRWLKLRLDRVLPTLMRRDKVQMWVLVAGEYNEDPVVETMLPATWLHARRRTILVFFDPGDGKPIEKLALARYPVGDFKPAWNPDEQPDQWAELARIIAARNPATIALNRSEDFPLADGLSATHYEAIVHAIGPDFAKRLVSPERLPLGWLETRIPEEMASYPTISRISHAIIEEGFSERVITPGVTTSDDVVWWFRNRINQLGLDTWFQPSVAIQRADGGAFSVQEMGHRGATIIMPGDMLHVDFGITYMGLNTDIQRLAYVLKPGETQAPKGLRDGIAAMNRVRAATIAALKPGRTGNEVLAAARRQVEAEKIDGTIYSHPIGFHGHAAGAPIGAWESQAPAPHRGEYRIDPNTAWSIELNAQANVPEWGGQKVRFMHEENGFLSTDGSFRFLDGGQEDFILVPRP
ncbi:M24 family metallopeptidase [Sphingomonas sp. TZW2008]|uniref:M24 family metallopeptidase n=1 Tax=Sphingomonas sp. TZW2008 TaxID=1917973 RepID=UPI00211A41A6|nr:M24 family metallopeptidase [Sphingomonas sp. TZW2008]